MEKAYRATVLALLLGLGGCTMRTGDLTLVATQNIPTLRAENRGQFEGEDCASFTPVNLEEAIDRAIEKGNGNALVDAVLYFEQYPFLNCFRAKGTVVRIKGEGEE